MYDAGRYIWCRPYMCASSYLCVSIWMYVCLYGSMMQTIHYHLYLPGETPEKQHTATFCTYSYLR